MCYQFDMIYKTWDADILVLTTFQTKQFFVLIFHIYFPDKPLNTIILFPAFVTICVWHIFVQCQKKQNTCGHWKRFKFIVNAQAEIALFTMNTLLFKPSPFNWTYLKWGKIENKSSVPSSPLSFQRPIFWEMSQGWVTGMRNMSEKKIKVDMYISVYIYMF